MYDRSRKIDRMIAADRREDLERRRDPKMLILGSGDSGKSTLLKQMKIIHGNGFTMNELDTYRILIKEFIIKSIKELVESQNVSNENEENKNTILNLKSAKYNLKEAEAIIQLWVDPKIQTHYHSTYCVHNSAEWFLPRAKLFAKNDYSLSNEGI